MRTLSTRLQWTRCRDQSGPPSGGDPGVLPLVCKLVAQELRLAPTSQWIERPARRYPYSSIQDVTFVTASRSIEVVVKTFHDRWGHDRLVSGEARAEAALHALQQLWHQMSPATGFTVPRPLAHLGPHLAMTRADGTCVESLWETAPSVAESAYRSLGVWLARLSMVPCQPVTDPREAFALEQKQTDANLKYCLSRGAISSREGRLLHARVDHLVQAIEPLLPTLHAGPCHGDFVPVNIYFQGNLTTAIDFETMRPGLWPRDVVSILVNLAIRLALNPTRRGLFRRCSWAFLEGRGVPSELISRELFQFFLLRELVAQLRVRVETPYKSMRPRLVAAYVRCAIRYLLLHPERQWGCS